VPFFLAGIGTIGAGLTLGIVQVSSLLVHCVYRALLWIG
jgi:hypothetical protein